MDCFVKYHHFVFNNRMPKIPIRNVTYTKCYLHECYLCEMLPRQSVLYSIHNVTIRKCTIRNVTCSELGTLEWITFNPNYLIRISTVETFNFSP